MNSHGKGKFWFVAPAAPPMCLLRLLMELDKIIRDLHEERRQLDEAIRALEKLAAGSLPRRGRPPKWLTALKEAGEITPGRLGRKLRPQE